MHRAFKIFTLLACLILIFPISESQSQQDIRLGINSLSKGGFSQVADKVAQLSRTGDIKLVPVFEALAEGNLYTRKADEIVFMGKEGGNVLHLTDAVTGAPAGEGTKVDFERIKVNNNLRRAVRTAIGALTLLSPDREVRFQAANSVFSSPSEDALELLESAIQSERDVIVKTVMEQARAAALVKSDRSVAEKRAAVKILSQRGDRNALAILSATQTSAEGELRTDIDNAIKELQTAQALWDAGQNVWYGLSLGSVLLLAAIGLAITFGVMGIINMAHGEMVMLGAYTTFIVQEIIRSSYPGLFDWSLIIALPIAFGVTGLIGLIIERGIIRFLYGRPLETLLATWGVSLMLQQGVRSIFGPSNREVGNPSWMSGGFELGGMTLTYNRMWIVVFSAGVFVMLLFLLKRSRFGLQMRAVTQNRRMASSMGIKTPWVDAFTFALGSGIAGIAGVALSQIDNVSPNLGQSYIIDSFMVVVFGGVGNLWGTLVGALSLGIVNKLLEPYTGAVLGKILILVLIILFIQRRPRGLFALKGRAVET
ncbi:urea ABC transporter permease subunit UrtB [Phyllobacterium sp. YR531]|uniref:urea ABC transporter permease subunit UrtB n=1 Tax=Phyllobacterium sp. YR531 TaxID=1144343 RepID=UPI00026F6C2F|nr:urea ABC transporter permease subunit UrtB [Phyllobacterium sp. YR531]EJN06243.1 urea ABC transporter, permease protein UrtB [Phyllobacterium sp. YR531]